MVLMGWAAARLTLRFSEVVGTDPYRCHMSDGIQHEHQKVPVEVATGRRLDLSRHDLGNPDDPDLWNRLYRQCRVGVLVCAACAEDSPARYLYLKRVNGNNRAYSWSPAAVAAAGLGEGPEHHALKDKVSELAERQGLHAEQEVRNDRGTRRTDVVVSGGVVQVGWEIQMSAINPPQLKRRITAAMSDGLVSSWLTMRGSSAFSALIDRAPACSTSKHLAAAELATLEDLRVVQGLKRLEIVRCTFHRTESWHRGLTCTGFHAKPAPLGEREHPTLARMITLTAAGDVVAIVWPRELATRNNRRPWLWVPKSDAEQFYEAERPHLIKLGMTTSVIVDEQGLPQAAGYHLGRLAIDEPVGCTEPAASRGLGSILGNVCPRCGWTRNKHGWSCSTGLSDHVEPTFR